MKFGICFALSTLRLLSREVEWQDSACGNELLAAYFVIASSIANGTVTLPPIRFVCKPDVLEFAGTEAA